MILLKSLFLARAQARIVSVNLFALPWAFANQAPSAIDALLTSFPKNSTPPFRAAILESGEYSYLPAPIPESHLAWDFLAAQLGCPGKYRSNLTCVRAANATTIQTIVSVNALGFTPVVDNVTFVKNPAARRLSGDIAKIPVLGGTVSQEGR